MYRFYTIEDTGLQADVLALDCPSLLSVTAATLLLRWVDDALIVVDAGKTRCAHWHSNCWQRFYRRVIPLAFRQEPSKGSDGQ